MKLLITADADVSRFKSEAEAAKVEFLNIPMAVGNIVPGAEGLVADSDLIFFADPVSAEIWLSSVPQLLIDESLIFGALSTCVIEVMRRYGVHADIVPVGCTPETLMASVGDFLGTQPGQGSMLLVGGTPLMQTEAGALAESVLARVRLVSPVESGPGATRVRALIAGGAVDGLIVDGCRDIVSFEAFLSRSIRSLSAELKLFASSVEGRQALAEVGMVAGPLPF